MESSLICMGSDLTITIPDFTFGKNLASARYKKTLGLIKAHKIAILIAGQWHPISNAVLC